ncbi:MAG: EpsI family protein [Candidatus Omnitrophica bacterium]|nr:EpsI family protein [Candidatus Omnitrophota bacterium]
MKKHWVVSSFLFVIVGAISFHFYQMQRVEKDIRDIREIPMEIGEWKASDVAVSDHDYEILETRNLALRQYRNKKGESVDLFVIYSETNRRVCHPPVVCLIGSGVSVTKTTKESLSFPGQTLTVNRLLAGEGKSQNVVLYWYMLGKEFTNDYFTQQIRWVMKQATGKGLGGAMVRIIVPISKSEEESLITAKRFIGELLPILTQEPHA